MVDSISGSGPKTRCINLCESSRIRDSRTRPPQTSSKNNTVPTNEKRKLQRTLIRWYRQSARDLPWRNTNDPYAIWVSEIMLQQTRIETATPYYERFLTRFPTVHKLAAARPDTVLKHWEGLGYYSRALNMHKAAKLIVSNFDGRLPPQRKTLLELPGIGPYTAGAISSIAFGAREPIVDTNVARVLCRLYQIETDPKTTQTRKQLWAIASDLVPRTSPGRFNQALMELGALICRARSPLCRDCCLSSLCRAGRAGLQDTLPKTSPTHRTIRKTVVVGIIHRRGKILIDRRPPRGLLGGLWEFPGGKQEPGETLQRALHRELREEMEIEVDIKRHIAAVNHAYTHFSIRLHAFLCTLRSGRPQPKTCTAWKWVLPKNLGRYAFPTATRKVIAIWKDAGIEDLES